jgi:hypothetical protein
MNRSRISILLVLAVATSLSIPSSIAATKPKGAGRSSTAVINTALNGKGAPSNALGINGDFYIDTRSLLISGPKKGGKWPAARSLQGSNGTNGTDGRNGNDAKSVSTASTVAGPAGPQGERGEKGVDGVAGSGGAAGAAGVAGATGANGPAGATGPAGSGSTGAQGPSGSNGTNGTNGSAGGTGLTGARGETGTVGPSEVTDISIPTWTLQTATAFGFATSSGFGLLKAGKSYQFSIQIWGTTNSADSPYGLELLTSTGAAPSYFYTIMPFRYAMESTTSNKLGFSVIGTITVGGTDVSLSVKVVDAVGDTTTKPMVLTGKALITLVGAVL